MSVWVEDMYVPKECYKCQFSYVNSWSQRICSRLEYECCSQFYCGGDGRLEHCPIHELPSSHGDLIDKNQLIAKMTRDGNKLVINEGDLQELEIIIPSE